MSETCKVHLLGREFLLRSPGDPDLLQEAAVLIEEKLADLPESVSVDTRDRYLLVMLNLAGEYLKEKRKNQAIEASWQERQENTLARSRSVEAALIERIEDALSY